MGFEPKQMRVEGQEIPKAVVSALVRRMKHKDGFRAGDLIEVAKKKLEANGMKPKNEIPFVAGRLVDRLVQRVRKSGNIAMGNEAGSRRKWSWVE